MRAVIKKWGNSASVRLSSAVMRASGLELDQTVSVRSEGHRIIIEPLHEDEADLFNLISMITPGNLHSEADFGSPRGKEAF